MPVPEPTKLPGWESEKRDKRMCPVCGKQTEAVIQIQARVRKGGETLSTRGVTLCNDHARQLFDEMHATLERYRNGTNGPTSQIS